MTWKSIRIQLILNVCKKLKRLNYFYRSKGEANDDSWHPDHSMDTERSFSVPVQPMPDEDIKYVVFESCLLNLFAACDECGKKTEVSKIVMGSMVKIRVTCPDGHTKQWSSQPMLAW